MELLEQLERHVATLLTRLEDLSRENTALRKTVEEAAAGQEAELRRLKADLEEERQKTTTARMRVETLIERIKERTDLE